MTDNAQQTHASRNLEEEEIVISSYPESETSEPVEQETRSNVDGDRYYVTEDTFMKRKATSNIQAGMLFSSSSESND